MTRPAPAPTLSVVTPAFDEARSLPLFHARLTEALAGLEVVEEGWEWIVVDDGSRDQTSEVIAELAATDGRVRGVRLERNHGSHAAILRGLTESRGRAVFILAADLQDPPKLATELLVHWRDGARIVWGVRDRYAAEGRVRVAFSTLYHALQRRAGGARGLPPGGAGCCLLDRAVVDVLCRAVPPPVDVFAAAGRLSLPSATVAYRRAPRAFGRSGWSTGKKVRFALRSLVAGVGRSDTREIHSR
jgi:dolichol-phosphate mannosyltransferase